MRRVAGTNRAGAWSPHELRLAVTARPAVHETGWFRALLVAGLVALAFAGHRFRIRRLEAHERELEGQVALRTGELAARGRELEAKNDELGVAYTRIEEAGLTDPLTGLRNRRFLEQAIGADVEVAIRRSGEPAQGGSELDAAREASLLFLLLDLDHFKSVNDRHGHAAGDAVLVEVAARLRASFRAADNLVRWGGEEFLVVARFVDPARGPELAAKLRAAIAAEPFLLPDGTALARTASIGFAALPFAAADPRAAGWEQVVHVADLALHAAKASGRDRWVGLAPAAHGPPAAALASLVSDPARAIAAGEIAVLASFPLTALRCGKTGDR